MLGKSNVTTMLKGYFTHLIRLDNIQWFNCRLYKSKSLKSNVETSILQDGRNLQETLLLEMMKQAFGLAFIGTLCINGSISPGNPFLIYFAFNRSRFAVILSRVLRRLKSDSVSPFKVRWSQRAKLDHNWPGNWVHGWLYSCANSWFNCSKPPGASGHFALG